jgi:hypothetical protein
MKARRIREMSKSKKGFSLAVLKSFGPPALLSVLVFLGAPSQTITLPYVKRRKSGFHKRALAGVSFV